MPDPVRVILRIDNEEHICKLMPIGWRDQSASWIFDFKNFGYGVKYTPDKFRFVKEDADFIRRCIDRYGISTAIDIIVQHRQNNWTFKDTWTGQTRFEDGYVNEIDFFEVNVVEGGLKRAIDKNGKTKFDMPFDEDSVDIHVTEGMTLHEQARYNFGNVFGVRDYNPTTKLYQGAFNLTLESNSFIATNDVIFQNQIGKNYVTATDVSQNFLKTLAVDEAQTIITKVKMNGKMNIAKPVPNSIVTIRIRLSPPLGNDFIEIGSFYFTNQIGEVEVLQGSGNFEPEYEQEFNINHDFGFVINNQEKG